MGGIDQAAQGIRERTGEAVASLPRKRDDMGAAVPVGESGGGTRGEGAEATREGGEAFQETGEGGVCQEKEGGDRCISKPSTTTTQSCNHQIINCCRDQNCIFVKVFWRWLQTQQISSQDSLSAEHLT